MEQSCLSRDLCCFFTRSFLPGFPCLQSTQPTHIPQYHVIFDDAFSTVPALNTPKEMDGQFTRLFETLRESFVDPHDVDAGRPLLTDDCLSPEELDSRRIQREARIRQLTP